MIRCFRLIDDSAGFEQLAAGVPATIGIAVAAPYPGEVFSLGKWSGGVAWSTIKVPLALAALRGDRPRSRRLAVKAITESDNPASERLWSLRGEPADAAERVQAVIRESGDTATVVESRRLRRGFTAFGQTHWTLERQARFAAQLPYLPGAADVVDLMHHITSDQRWGLAAKGVAARGGWRLPGPAVRHRANRIRTRGCGAGSRGARWRIRHRCGGAQQSDRLARQPPSRANPGLTPLPLGPAWMA